MTKKELTKRCQEIWASYEQKERVSDSDKDWLIQNVFSFHPNWEWWEKQKPVAVSVARSSKYGTPCFYIHFETGISVSISYTKAIKNIRKPSGKKAIYPPFDYQCASRFAALLGMEDKKSSRKKYARFCGN